MLNRILSIFPGLNGIRMLNFSQHLVLQKRVITKKLADQQTHYRNFNYDRASYKNSQKSLNYCHSSGFSSTKLTKQQINKSSYAELVEKITKLYNYQEYKIPSALSLLEIHHQYKIFRPGDWVLDIGAGPNWAWTDLALKLTHKPDGSNKVISNDLRQCDKEKQENICVVGNFLDEQVRTKIAMNLVEKQLNTILIDATPQFTGNQNRDSQYTLSIFLEALRFSEFYLKKGGTIVFKTIQSPLTLKNQQQAKFFFHQVYKYKSGNFRPNSPALFFVLKGYMMTENYQAVFKFAKQYEKAKGKMEKIQIVQKYKKNYEWDPVQIVINQAKQKIMRLKGEGRKNKDIVVMFENDPYVKASKILELIDKAEDKKANPISKQKARRELLLGQKDTTFNLPETKQQFAEIFFQRMEQIEQEQKQLKQKKKDKKNKKQNPAEMKKAQDRAPLEDNQQYMKSTAINDEDKQFGNSRMQYFAQDLYGFNQENPASPINRSSKKNQKQRMRQNEQQIEKLIKSFPEVKEAMQKNKTTFQEETRKAQQKLRQSLFSKNDQYKSDKKIDQSINMEDQVKKFKRSQFETEEQQNDEEFLKTKSYNLNKKKFSNLDKEDFDFDTANLDEKYEEVNQEQSNKILEEDFDQQTKVEYLKSKPRKASRQLNQKISRRQQGSYFKTKKIDLDFE